MCSAEAAIQRSLAWLRFCSGWPRSRHACRSSAMVVSWASLTGTTVDAWIDASKAPPPRLAPPGHEGAVSELRQRRGKPPGGFLGPSSSAKSASPWTDRTQQKTINCQSEPTLPRVAGYA